jgi:hypothetical protein
MMKEKIMASYDYKLQCVSEPKDWIAINEVSSDRIYIRSRENDSTAEVALSKETAYQLADKILELAEGLKEFSEHDEY